MNTKTKWVASLFAILLFSGIVASVPEFDGDIYVDVDAYVRDGYVEIFGETYMMYGPGEVITTGV